MKQRQYKSKIQKHKAEGYMVKGNEERKKVTPKCPDTKKTARNK